jgi:hypothetical protein
LQDAAMKQTGRSKLAESRARPSVAPPSPRASFGKDFIWDEATKVAVAGTFTMAASLGINRFVYTPLPPMMQEALWLSAARPG